MIVKKVLRDVKKAGRRDRSDEVRQLLDYIVGASASWKESSERLLATGWRGFISDTYEGRREEMVALASEAKRSVMPVQHWVMSWREGEQPSVAQVEEAVDILLRGLGLEGHQAIWGLHGDTGNIHLHVVVNRAYAQDGQDGGVVRVVDTGFDIDKAHRAIAIIEHRQGWQSERRARYTVDESGQVVRRRRSQEDGERSEPRSTRARDLEARTGEASAQRKALRAWDAIGRARSWQELHDGLAALGMEYRKRGSGGVVVIDGVAVKASGVARGASLQALEKRLGPYEEAGQREGKRQEESPASAGSKDTAGTAASAGGEASAGSKDTAGTAGASEGVYEAFPFWREYAAERRRWQQARQQAFAGLREQHSREREELRMQQREHRAAVLRGSWRGRGYELAAMRSVLAYEHAVQRAQLAEQHKARWRALRQRMPPFPPFEEWLRQQGMDSLADRWRYRASLEPGGVFEGPPTAAVPRDIRGMRHAVLDGGRVEYLWSDSAEGAPAFVDTGSRLLVYDDSEEGVLAALQMAQAKWGRDFTVSGSEHFVHTCIKVAARHGIAIKGYEKAIEARQRQQQQKAQQEGVSAMEATISQDFIRYAQAVGAPRFRVTCIRMTEKEKLAFLFGGKEGLTAEKVVQSIDELLRMNRRGENIYLTPLSEKLWYFIIDDLSLESMEKLEKDGFRPAVVLETSPGKWQAILVVPRVGAGDAERKAANTLVQKLNKQYGDPHFSGVIHPHRMPGLENRKPKYCEAGRYPRVRLVKAVSQECRHTASLLKAELAEAELAQLEASRLRQTVAATAAQTVTVASSSSDAAVAAAVVAYWCHHRDALKVLRAKTGSVDASRLDAMIAVRMRATGHSKAAIRAAMAQCAPLARGPGGEHAHQWVDYARRTVDLYAFGPEGSRQMERLAAWVQTWKKLEAAAAAEAEHKQQQGRRDGLEEKADVRLLDMQSPDEEQDEEQRDA